MNKLERLIAERRFLIGTLVTIASPALAEALSNTMRRPQSAKSLADLH